MKRPSPRGALSRAAMRRALAACLNGAICALIACGAASAQGRDALTLQLGGPVGARAAGYVMAAERGLYAAQGLTVTLQPAAEGETSAQALASGRADVAVDSLPAALLARQNGLPMVNVAQPFARSDLTLACLEQSAVHEPASDLRGKIVGMGAGSPALLAWLAGQGLSSRDVTLRAAPDGVAAIQGKRVDCIAAHALDEVERLREAGIALTLQPMRLAGSDIPEGGLYALQTDLDDPAQRSRLAALVRASLEGWSYAADHPDETAAVLSRRTGTATEGQRRMLQDILPMLSPDATLSAGQAQESVAAMSAGPEPLLVGPPVGAWSADLRTRSAQPSQD